MNMPNDEYYKMREIISEWRGTQESLQKLYDEIYYKYDDGAEMLRRLDSYQRQYSMNLH